MITNDITKISNISQLSIKKQLLDYSSRFNNSDLIYYSDFNILTFETYDRVFNPTIINKNILPEEIKYYAITSGTQYKPWLASTDIYNDPGYWWVLMEYNNIFDVEEFTIGRTIKVPPLRVIGM